jgi:hypothetical protein
MLTGLVLSVAFPAVARAGYSPFHPFNPRANTKALVEKIAEEFAGAAIPPQGEILCSNGEHSPNGPASYCAVEFTTGGSWNLAEVSMTLDLVGGTGVLANTYRHTTWKREWRRCPLGRGVPGRLLSNDACGNQAPGDVRPVTDAEMIQFQLLPRLRKQRPIHSISRTFALAGVVPSISRFRAVRRGAVYTLTNALGDSLRYQAAGGR